MQTSNQSRSWKYMLAGTLAGASGAIGLMLAVTLGLSVGLLWQYLYYRNIVVLNDRATTTMIEDVGQIPAFLWGSRWILIGMAVIGIPLARMERFAQRYSPPWRDRITVTALLAIIGALVISGLLAQTDRALYTDINRVEGSGLPTLQELQNSIWYLLMIGVALALAIGGALWLYWSWWYARWRRWMHLDTATAPRDAPERSSDDWFAQRRAHERQQRIVLLLLGGSILFTIAAIGGYEYVRSTIQSGDLSVETVAPAAAVRLMITRPTRALVIENTFGTGTATVTLLSSRDRSPVAAPLQLAFKEGILGSQRVELNVADLPAGEYLLAAQLGDGSGSRVGYALLQGNATLTLLTAILVGIGVGAALAMIALTFSSFAERRLTGTQDRV
ncbi:MAG: hypothetical protein ABIV47_11385 [Roseiflexaceae bacterium]